MSGVIINSLIVVELISGVTCLYLALTDKFWDMPFTALTVFLAGAVAGVALLITYTSEYEREAYRIETSMVISNQAQVYQCNRGNLFQISMESSGDGSPTTTRKQITSQKLLSICA